jgi:hypothetical protein
MREGAFSMRYRWLPLVLLGFFCLIPQISSGQSQLINGDRVLVGTLNFGDAAGSTGDTYVAALNPAITTYIPGARFLFKAPNPNVGAATLNLNGVGAKTIVKVVGGVPTTLADNDIRAGQYVEVVYDNTGDNFQILSTLGNAGGGNVSNTGTPTNTQLALWTNATTIQGLTALPATNFPALTGVVTTTAGTLATAPGTIVKSAYIPAGSMDVTGACAVIATAALLTNGPKLVTIGCTDTDTDAIEFELKMPNNWNASTIQIELDAFSIGNNSAEVFTMNFSGQCVRTGDSVAAHTVTSGATATSSTNVAATITWGASANREQFVTTTALTLNGTCAAGSHVYLHGLVNAATGGAATTMAPMTDLRIIGARVIFTTVGADN